MLKSCKTGFRIQGCGLNGEATGRNNVPRQRRIGIIAYKNDVVQPFACSIRTVNIRGNYNFLR